MGLIFRTEAEQEQHNNNCPCLLWFKELSGEHRLLDPNARTFRPFKLPEFDSSVQILSSAHGWLLLLSRISSSLFFLNPFTTQRIDLPYRKSLFDAAAFSGPPTSQHCIVFAVEKPFLRPWIKVDVLRVGERPSPRWERYTLDANGFNTVTMAVCCTNNGSSSNSNISGGDGDNDVGLYCVDCVGKIGIFSVGRRSLWSVVYEMKSKLVKNSYLIEVGGEIRVAERGLGGGLNGFYRLKNVGGGKVELEKEGGELGKNLVVLGACGSSSSFSSAAVAAAAHDDLNSRWRDGKMEIFSAEFKGYGVCTIYKMEGLECKRKFTMGSLDLGLEYTPIWIAKSN